jgi:hypothetical protein
MRLSTTSLVGIAIWGGPAIAQSPAPVQARASCGEPIYGGMTLVDWQIDPHFVYFAPESVIRPKRRLADLIAAMRASLNTTLTTPTNYTNFKKERTTTVLNNMLDSSCSMELITTTGHASVSKLWNMLLNSMAESRLLDLNITHRSVEDYVEKLQSVVLPRHVSVLVYRPGSNPFQVPSIAWSITCPATSSAGVGMKEEVNCSRCANIKEDLDGICRMPQAFKQLKDMDLKSYGILCKGESPEGNSEGYCWKKNKDGVVFDFSSVNKVNIDGWQYV